MKIKKKIKKVEIEAPVKRSGIQWSKKDRPDDLAKVSQASAIFGKTEPTLMAKVHAGKIHVWKPLEDASTGGGRKLQFLVSLREIEKKLKYIRITGDLYATLKLYLERAEKNLIKAKQAFRLLSKEKQR